MPKDENAPQRDEKRWTEISEKVKAAIKSVIDPHLEVTEVSELTAHLLMSQIRKESMWRKYTEISESYPGGASIDDYSAGNCETVKAAIQLVYEKSFGDK